jgi:hypothetical protein
MPKLKKALQYFFHHFPLPLILDTKFKKVFKNPEQSYLIPKKLKKWTQDVELDCENGILITQHRFCCQNALPKQFYIFVILFGTYTMHINCAQSENLHKNQLCCQKKKSGVIVNLIILLFQKNWIL